MTAALKGGEWSAALPGHTLPPGKTQYPLYRRLDGWNISSPPGFDPGPSSPWLYRYIYIYKLIIEDGTVAE